MIMWIARLTLCALGRHKYSRPNNPWAVPVRVHLHCQRRCGDGNPASNPGRDALIPDG